MVTRGPRHNWVCYFAELRASSTDPRASIAKAIPRIQYMLS